MKIEQFKYLLFVAIFLSGMSCEKVIELPLNNADQKLVVDAVFKDGLGDNYVKLSLSGSVYETVNFPAVTDGVVTITDEDAGEVFDLVHEGGGFYRAPLLIIEPQTKYTLQIEANSQTVTSTTQTFKKPKIDSLTYVPISGAFVGSEDDTVNLVSYHSVDPADEVNHYWVKIFRNGRENSGFYLGDDSFINGQYYNPQFFGSEAKAGDTVLVEIMAVDDASYDYLVGLNANIDTGPFSAAPANPPSNLVGDVLGWCGVFTTDTMTLIIPE